MKPVNIVRDWLIKHGYDGLCNSDYGCGCRLDNLMPCEELTNCQPGYLVYDDPVNYPNGYISTEKPILGAGSVNFKQITAEGPELSKEG